MKPSSVIGHPNLALEFQCRHRVLALGQKIDCQKPGGEGKLRPREDRSGRERGLMVAGMTLISPDRQQAEAVVVAGRTAKSLRPPMAKHRLPALRLGSELFLKVPKTQAFLELHPIFGHDRSVMEILINPSKYSITRKAKFYE